MKNIKVLFFVALFTPWVSRAEASPTKFQETVLVAETQQLSGVDTFSEGGVFLPLTIDKNSIHNQGTTFLVAQIKRFPGAVNGNKVPNAVNIKRFPENTGVKKVFVSPTVLQKLTSVGDKFLLDFTKNETFNNPFTSTDLGQIAVDTNNQLVAGALWETIDVLTLTFDGKTTSFETLDALNAAMYDIIADPLTKGTVELNILGVIVEYGIALK